MSFNRPTLKAALKAAFDAARANTTDADQALDDLCEAISNEVAEQVKACIDGTEVTHVVVPVLTSPAGPVTGDITIETTLISQLT